MKTIIGIVSSTGSRAALPSNFTSISCRCSAESARSACVIGVPYCMDWISTAGQSARALQPGALAEVDQCRPGIGVHLHLVRGPRQFLGDRRVGIADLGSDPLDARLQAQPGLAANHHHIQRIGHAGFQRAQVALAQALHDLVGRQQADAGGYREHRDRVWYVAVQQP